jgi:ligand-binding SRPBCC domain-containing protein
MIEFVQRTPGIHQLHASTFLPRKIEDVFPFFADAENLSRITPPELHFRIRTPLPVRMAVGTRIGYRLRLFGVPFSWTTLITEWSPPQGFTDRQERGPYHTWIHSHSFRDAPEGTIMEDRVTFQLPLGWVSRPALPLVRLQLRRIFGYREKAIRRCLLDA